MTAATGRRRRRSQGQKGQEADVDRAGEAVEAAGAAREGRRRHGWCWVWYDLIGKKDRSMSLTELADIQRTNG